MDVLRIAQGDNDSDTSQEDFEDEEEPETAGTVPENENDSIAHVTGHHLECGFDKWKRPVIPLGKNEDINFMIMDSDFGILPTRKVHENIQVLLNPKLQDSSLEQSYIRLSLIELLPMPLVLIELQAPNLFEFDVDCME